MRTDIDIELAAHELTKNQLVALVKELQRENLSLAVVAGHPAQAADPAAAGTDETIDQGRGG